MLSHLAQPGKPLPAKRPTAETLVEYSAAALFGGALVFALVVLAPVGTPAVPLVGAITGVAGFVLVATLLRAIPAPKPRRLVTAVTAWPHDELRASFGANAAKAVVASETAPVAAEPVVTPSMAVQPAVAEPVASVAADDVLDLVDEAVAADVAAPTVAEAAEGDELLLDDTMVPARDNRVVSLCEVRADVAGTPTAGELKARIDQHLQRGADEAVAPRPSTPAPDANDALNAALAELRQSLRGNAR